jgi:hypothetical protein
MNDQLNGIPHQHVDSIIEKSKSIEKDILDITGRPVIRVF